MKPTLFIGSSKEDREVAEAIHFQLQGEAECTVWTEGVFGLSETNVQNLMKQVHTSEFAVFVFSPNDAVRMRGELYFAPRDNVVYELGLFSGALGPDRCFFVIPEGKDMHLPSDLLGMTAGRYETGRRYPNMLAAVGPFCTMVRNKINDLTLHFVRPEQDAKLTADWQIFTFEYGARSSDVFFFSQKGNRWWPRNERAEPTTAPNSYQVRLLLSVPGRETIHAIRANALGTIFLQWYFDFTKKLHTSGLSKTEMQKLGLWYPGFTTEELPRGLTLLDSIRVDL
jgi:Predicted nucleotide-binding protein containing TIR-like domain